jgi:hypothetical protein
VLYRSGTWVGPVNLCPHAAQQWNRNRVLLGAAAFGPGDLAQPSPEQAFVDPRRFRNEFDKWS